MVVLSGRAVSPGFEVKCLLAGAARVLGEDRSVEELARRTLALLAGGEPAEKPVSPPRQAAESFPAPAAPEPAASPLRAAPSLPAVAPVAPAEPAKPAPAEPQDLTAELWWHESGLAAIWCDQALLIGLRCEMLLDPEERGRPELYRVEIVRAHFKCAPDGRDGYLHEAAVQRAPAPTPAAARPAAPGPAPRPDALFRVVLVEHNPGGLPSPLRAEIGRIDGVLMETLGSLVGLRARARRGGLDLVLYLVVGGVTGLLVDAEYARRRRQEELARELTASLEDLAEAERQVVRAGRLAALGQLTAGLAHEIKNPLYALRGTAEIVGDALTPGSDEARMQGLHLAEIDRLAGVLERFLGFARPSAPSLGLVDLGAVAGRVVDLVAAQARRQGVAVASDPTAPAVVQGDAEQLVQAALSVALNALDAIAGSGRPGQLTLTVAPGQRGRHHFHVLHLENDGPPIPEEHLEHIFDPFFTTREAGTGLGLSIAARIADAHGGWLTAANVEGGGVRFSLWLPAGD